MITHELLSAVAALALTVACSGPRQKAREVLKANSRAFTPEAFIACVKYDNLNSTKTYLTAGMDPNVADSQGWTPLMWAAKDANLPVLEALIAAQADPNQKTKDGLTAYRIAAAASRWEMASALKEAGAELSPSDLSAFHLAMAKQALAVGLPPIAWTRS
jgi:ankyrin repeat protein